MKTLLHTEGLSVGHGRSPVVEGIDMHIEAGEMIALIGVNGSGKSTLLRTLAGLRPALAGRVLIDGQPLATLTSMARARRIAVVLTGRPMVGLLDVRTLVSLGRQPWTGHMGKLSADDLRKVDEAMACTGTAVFAERGMDMLSDGERQKVMIARALAQGTPMLLLDEPTAFLDLVNRVQVMRLLRSIAHDLGRGVLLSTHDLRTALDLADRIALLHGGRMWVGTPEVALKDGVLAAAFQGEGLTFDARTGTLR